VGDVAGWHPDPAGRHELRYHNGVDWTADVADDGRRFVDPSGTGSRPRGGTARAAMVLGIVAVATAWIPFVTVVGIGAAVAALAFGAAGMRRASRTGAPRDPAIVGLVTGGLGLLAGVIGVLLSVVIVRAIDAYDDPNPNEVAVTTCRTAGGSTTAEGSLTNLGTTVGDFVVRIEFSPAGTDDVRQRARVTLDDVPAGGTARFTVERAIGIDDVTCRPGTVTGPLPFGLDLNP
jgi:hypothetical protein